MERDRPAAKRGNTSAAGHCPELQPERMGVRAPRVRPARIGRVEQNLAVTTAYVGHRKTNAFSH